jgi:hypothetical protein
MFGREKLQVGFLERVVSEFLALDGNCLRCLADFSLGNTRVAIFTRSGVIERGSFSYLASRDSSDLILSWDSGSLVMAAMFRTWCRTSSSV